MKRIETIPDWFGPALLLFILFLALPVGWLMREAVQSTIIDPVAFLLWSLGLRLSGLPQGEIWIFFVLLAAVHMIHTLVKEVSLPPLSRRSLSRPGPVQSWLDTLVLNSEPRQMGRIPLRRLQQVILAVLAQQERVSLSEMRSRLRTGRLSIDPELQAFLQTGKSQLAPPGISVTEAPELEALISFVEGKLMQL